MSIYSHPKTIDLVWISLAMEIQHPTSVLKAIHLRKEGKLDKKQENWKQICRSLLQSQFFFCLELPACCQFSASHTRKHCKLFSHLHIQATLENQYVRNSSETAFASWKQFFSQQMLCVYANGETLRKAMFSYLKGLGPSCLISRAQLFKIWLMLTQD